MSRVVIVAVLVAGVHGDYSFGADDDGQRDSPEIQAIKRQIEELQHFAGPSHPKVVRLQQQLQIALARQPVQPDVEDETQAFLRDLRDELTSLRQRVARLESTRASQAYKVHAVPLESGDQRKAIVKLSQFFHDKYRLELADRNSSLWVRGEPTAVELIKSAVGFLKGTVPKQTEATNKNPFEP
jgi:hypothetical protein